MNKSSSSSSDSVISDETEREPAKSSRADRVKKAERRRSRSRSRSHSRSKNKHRHHHSHSRRHRSRSRDHKHKHRSHHRRSRSRSVSRSRKDDRRKKTDVQTKLDEKLHLERHEPKTISSEQSQPGESSETSKSASTDLQSSREQCVSEQDADTTLASSTNQQTSASFDGFQFTASKQPLMKLHPALRNLPSLNGTHPALAAIQQLNASRQLAGKPPLSASTNEALASASMIAPNVNVPTGYPSFYNPQVVNPAKQAELEQKRRKLWTNARSNEVQDAAAREKWAGVALATGNAECAARLIGLRDVAELEHDEAANQRAAEMRRKQTELFNALERDYELARLATHTHQQAGFGTFKPTSLQSTSSSNPNSLDRTKTVT